MTIECKIQEALVKITGYPKDKGEGKGKAKQTKSQVRYAVESMKNKVKKMLN